jgi:ferredoxin
MMMRKIIRINEELCTGCGKCIPSCPEGALQILDGKARIISDLFCDGLGACIGHCPEGAIIIEEREAEKYDEGKVMENVVKQGKNVIKAHLEHLKDHNQDEYLQEAVTFLKEQNMEVPIEEPAGEQTGEVLPCGCPGSTVKDLGEPAHTVGSHQESQLRQWPVQLMLVPPTAPFLKGADLLIASDCVLCAHPNFHRELLKGKILLVGCPKFDDTEYYREKLTQMFTDNDVRSVTVAIMEVPCCSGLYTVVSNAIRESGKEIPVERLVITIRGVVQ